jgi:hypothetical protein
MPSYTAQIVRGGAAAIRFITVGLQLDLRAHLSSRFDPIAGADCGMGAALAGFDGEPVATVITCTIVETVSRSSCSINEARLKGLDLFH